MKPIYLLAKNERELYFQSAADISKIPFPIIEKDYWVVWILEQLFALPDLKSHLTFKGGTSLSKVFGIIDRFSEDVDVSIEREFLGFGDSQDPEKTPSKKKQRAILEDLSRACSKYVHNKMCADLKIRIAEKFGTTEGWEIAIDTEDLDAQTLFFEYPRST